MYGHIYKNKTLYMLFCAQDANGMMNEHVQMHVYKRFRYERAVSLSSFSTAYVVIFHSVQCLEVNGVIFRFAYIGGISDQCMHYKTNIQYTI